MSDRVFLQWDSPRVAVISLPEHGGPDRPRLAGTELFWGWIFPAFLRKRRNSKAASKTLCFCN